MNDPFSWAAGLVHEHLVIPALYALDLMAWEDTGYTFALLALYGAAQVAAMLAICVPLERLRPVERWEDHGVVWTDVLYTLIARMGLLPLLAFVVFRDVQATLEGFLLDHGFVPPTLEMLVPWLAGAPLVSFALYVVIFDFTDYWRHRLQHAVGWWWALHSVHHSQAQMTFWTDDRNHVLDDLISIVWFGAVALLIGIPPMQFPLVVLALRLIESLSHANARLHFGLVGERLLVSPRFHRAHHGIRAAGRRSVNFGAILPVWDIIFGTADFDRDFAARTGDPTADAAMVRGSWLAQQWSGIRRLAGSWARRRAPAPRRR